MDQLETEKRTLQLRMDPCEDPQLVPSAIQPCPPSVPLVLGPPMDKNNAADTATNLANHIRVLKTECGRLKHQLSLGKQTADLVMFFVAQFDEFFFFWSIFSQV